jgi:hypothetical protein
MHCAFNISTIFFTQYYFEQDHDNKNALQFQNFMSNLTSKQRAEWAWLRMSFDKKKSP